MDKNACTGRKLHTMNKISQPELPWISFKMNNYVKWICNFQQRERLGYRFCSPEGDHCHNRSHYFFFHFCILTALIKGRKNGESWEYVNMCAHWHFFTLFVEIAHDGDLNAGKGALHEFGSGVLVTKVPILHSGSCSNLAGFFLLWRLLLNIFTAVLRR